MATDSFGAAGLTVETLTEIIADITTGLQDIYGANINVDPNSPDGQMINIFSQACADFRELALQVNAGFDPDQAVGSILDSRVAINNIERNGGTYTIVPITVVTGATVNLVGLDSQFNNPQGTGYTIQDDAGNQYILIDSITLTAGTNIIDFRAQTIGAVTPTVNTITTPVTIVIGVTSVNNPSNPLSVGEEEETDTQLRIRRQQSVANNNSSYLNGLLGTILALTGVVSAQLYENPTSGTVSTMVPYSMWLIVDGGANTDIANAIYSKKSYGCAMNGATTVDVTTASGATFAAQFDRPTPETLYIKFNIQPTVSSPSLNVGLISAYMAANLMYAVGQFAETSSLTAAALAAINATGNGGVPTDVKISVDNSTWVDYLTTTGLNYQWAISSAHITPTVL